MASAGELAVTVDCNLFRGKTHVNPISRLLEPIANAMGGRRFHRGVFIGIDRRTGQYMLHAEGEGPDDKRAAEEAHRATLREEGRQRARTLAWRSTAAVPRTQ